MRTGGGESSSVAPPTLLQFETGSLIEPGADWIGTAG